MFKRVILLFILLAVTYGAIVELQVFRSDSSQKPHPIQHVEEEATHKVYNFSFSKYSTEGEKELEIEGDSANILAKTVDLMNVVAKAYAQETPVTITADEGYYDKIEEKVHLKRNVVATTEDGARLLTEELDIIPATKIMETDVLAEVKKDNINIDGEGARGDSYLKRVRFKKNVTVVVQDVDNQAESPTVITCDGPLVIDYDKNIAHFRDNVVAKDMRGTLIADRMDVFYNRESRHISKILAMGNVVIENPDGNKTYSDNVLYLAEEGRMILGGDTEALYFGGESDSTQQPFSELF